MQVMDACSACFEQRQVFTHQVLAKVLNQLVCISNAEPFSLNNYEIFMHIPLENYLSTYISVQNLILYVPFRNLNFLYMHPYAYKNADL